MYTYIHTVYKVNLLNPKVNVKVNFNILILIHLIVGEKLKYAIYSNTINTYN